MEEKKMKWVWLVLCAFVLAAAAQDDGTGLEAEDETSVVDLEHETFDELVHRSRYGWVVMLTVPDDQCPQCAMMKSTLTSAARMAKGIVKVGVVDMSNKENAKLLGGGQIAVPSLRVYVKPGTRNAYKKNEWYREFQLYNGQQNARSIKRFLYDEFAKDAPIDIITLKNWTSWTAAQDGVNKVVMLSSKKTVNGLIAGLARVLSTYDNVKMAQFSEFNANKENDEENKVLKGFGDAISDVPSLVVFDEKQQKWVEMAKAELSKATLDDMLSFVGQHIELASSSFSSSSTADNKGEKSSGAQDEARKEQQRAANGVIVSDRLFTVSISSMRMPIVVALRKTEFVPNTDEKDQYPQDWSKFRAKSHGLGMYVVYCNEGEKLQKKAPKLFENLCSEKNMQLKDDGNGWIYLMYEFSNTPPGGENQDGPRVPKQVESLSKARADGLASIPEMVIPLQPGMVQGLVSMAVQSKTTPFILFGTQKDPPQMLISIAAATQGLAMIGYRANPTTQELAQEFGLPETMKPPLFAGLIVEEGEKPGENRMMISLYDKMRFGKFSYISMLSYLIQVALTSAEKDHAKAWLKEHGPSVGLNIPEEELDGDEMSADPTVASGNDQAIDTTMSFDDPKTPIPEIDSASKWNSLCGEDSNQMICVIGFFDGDPLNADLNEQKTKLQASRETSLETPAGKAKLRFVWVDATCHTKFASQLDIDPAGLPGVVAFHPKKKVAFKMFAGYVQEKLDKFLNGVIAGYSKGARILESRPIWDDIDCSTLPSRAKLDDVEDDDDEDDMLAEIRAEEARERRERQEQLKRDMEELKKEQKASQEAPKKRRRRRRRRRSNPEKDEL